MITRLAIALIIFSPKLLADELALGLVTAHLINVPGVSQKYSGCLHKSCEVIYNPLLAYRFTTDEYGPKYDMNRRRWVKAKDGYTAHTILGGLNSVHEAMGGYYFSSGFWSGNHKLGIAGGGYLQDNRKFYARGVVPFALFEINGTGFTPIVGIEYQYFFDKHLFTSAIITPAVANFGLGISF